MIKIITQQYIVKMIESISFIISKHPYSLTSSKENKSKSNIIEWIGL